MNQLGQYILPAENSLQHARRRLACFLGFHSRVSASYGMTVHGVMWVERCICQRRRVMSLRTPWTEWSHAVSDPLPIP